MPLSKRRRELWEELAQSWLCQKYKERDELVPKTNQNNARSQVKPRCLLERPIKLVGKRWTLGCGTGGRKENTYGKSRMNTSQLPVALKLVKGQEIIVKSTANPNMPGNTAPLATLVSAQATLTAANAAVEANRLNAKELILTRDVALAGWNSALTGLAAFTESVTGGDAVKIVSTGFDVRAAATPPQPLGQILNVRVNFTGVPGHSEVRWQRDAYADAYMVQRSPEPITETSWGNQGTR